MEQGKEDKKFRQIIKPLAGMAIAVLLNIVLNRAVQALGLPLFIDNVGTILAAILGGYLPGIIVGYISNVINMTASIENAYYASLSVLIAVTASYLAKKGFFEKFSKALLSIPIFAFIGGALGSMLTFLIYGFGIGEGISAPFARQLLESGSFSVFWAQFLSDVVIDIVDKAITVVLAFAMVKLIPAKLKDGLWLTGWKQKPIEDEAIRDKEKAVVRGFSLKFKIFAIVAGIMIFILGFFSRNWVIPLFLLPSSLEPPALAPSFFLNKSFKSETSLPRPAGTFYMPRHLIVFFKK